MKCLLLLISITCLGCSQYTWLHEKGYCVAEAYRGFYDNIPLNEKAVFEEEQLDYNLPFIFKADTITYVKDSSLLFYGKEIPIDILQVKTKFAFMEKKGIFPVPFRKSKNSFQFPIYVNHQLDSSIQKSIIDEMLAQSVGIIYLADKCFEVLAKGSARVISIYSEEQLVYLLDDYVLIIPQPLPYGQYSIVPLGCGGILGDGYTLVTEGLGFICGHTVIFTEEGYELYLNQLDVDKLYKNWPK